MNIILGANEGTIGRRHISTDEHDVDIEFPTSDLTKQQSTSKNNEQMMNSQSKTKEIIQHGK